MDPHCLKADPSLELDTTAYWMRQRFGVSPLFFSLVSFQDSSEFSSQDYVVTPGNAFFMRHGAENGKCVAVGE